jgi:hypothetical protein
MPARSPTFQTPISENIDRKRLVFATIIESGLTSIVFHAVCATERNWGVLCVRVDFATPSNRSLSVVGEIPQDVLFARTPRGILAVDARDSTLFWARERQFGREVLGLADIEQIQSSSKNVVLSDVNGQLIELDPDFTQSRVIGCVTNYYISTFAVSSSFSTIVVGTNDGKVIMYSTTGTECSVRCFCEVNAAPKRIVITEGWGFILVEAGNYLYLFGINGKLIRKVEFGFVTTEIVTFRCELGYDFVVIATEKGQIRLFEAFYMKVDEVIFMVKSRVVAMSYVMSSRALAVITCDGEVFFVPKELPAVG